MSTSKNRNCTAAVQWVGIAWLGLVLGSNLTTGAMMARHYQHKPGVLESNR